MAVNFLRAVLSEPLRPQNYQAMTQLERGSLPLDNSRLDKRFDDNSPSQQDENDSSGSTLRTRVHPRIIADATIGLSDGLTVPFALTAGLSALGDTRVVIYGGLAELIAGGISMGLGGYLGAKGEAESYQAALAETREVVAMREERRIATMIRGAFERYHFADETLDCMTRNLIAQPEELVDFLMKFHHQLAEADYAPSRALMCGATISAGYFFGGLIPLLPYLFFSHIQQAFFTSIAVMALALFAFGWIKTSLIGETSRRVCFNNAVQMMVLGGVAAAAAVGCVKVIGG